MPRRSRTGKATRIPSHCLALARQGSDRALVMPCHSVAMPVAKACCDDGDREDAAHRLIDLCAEDNVRIGVRHLVDRLGRLVHLLQSHVRRASNCEDNARRLRNREVNQRRGHGGDRRVARTPLSLGGPDAHERQARRAHDRLHVGEVDVNESRPDDNIRDADHALPQDVVCNAEGLLKRRALLNDVEQPIIGDDDHRVHVRLQPFHRRVRLLRSPHALEGEGLGHDTHCEAARRLGRFRDNWRGA
mmetsp:Transcript_44238/g.116253  ORF Transcript_44238/g.116253 Transcript_44238/m.116253 type:complete len:246 (-) Transcript_44238:488-1225(-)